MTILRAVVVVGVAVGPVSPAQAGPCEQVKSACENAGFVVGGEKAGIGLIIDCVGPIMNGEAQRPEAKKPLPQVDKDVVAACHAKNPKFGAGARRAATPDAVAAPAQQPGDGAVQATLPVSQPVPHHRQEFCNATVNMLTTTQYDKIYDLVAKFVSGGGATGVEIAIQKKGKTVLEVGCGTIASDSKVVPDADTRWQIDSVTKVFTAMAVLKLAEDGKIDLDKGLGTYMKPDASWWETIPVRYFLAMATGIADVPASVNYEVSIDKAAKQPPVFTPPGSDYKYSDPNFFILGNLIAKVKNDYGTYVTDTILKPLGMTDTGLIDWGKGDHWPTPYNNGNKAKPRAPIAGWSGGGFVSTMHDLEKFASALYDKKILSEKSYKEMWTPFKFVGGKKAGELSKFGLGWDIWRDSSNNVTAVSKNGGGWGWGAQINIYPPSDETIIVVCNGSGAVGTLAGNIHGAL